jgi:hypothetical protein
MAKKHEESDKSTWAETYAYHPDDDALRLAGFRIRWRPRRGPNIWRGPDGKDYAEGDALGLIGRTTATTRGA